MKKMRLLVVALLFLAGCTKFDILKNPELETQKSVTTEISTTLPKEEESEIVQEVTPQVIEPEVKQEPEIAKSSEVENVEVVEAVPEINETEDEISSSKENEIVNKFINLEMLKNSNVAIEIVDLTTGKKVAEYNSTKVVTPASIMKVVTSAAAYETLGANTTLETKLVYTGKIDGNGILEGDIYILGGGDPTLGSDGIRVEQTKFMKEWIEKIKASGIKQVKGEIIVIDNLFGYTGVEEKWLWEDFGTSYAPGTYGISVFDNLYTLYLSSDSKKVKVLRTEPKIDGLKFENRLKISPNGRRDFSIKGLPFENKRVLNGEFPANVEKYSTKSDIPNPGLFLGEYLKKSLKEAGIKVEGEVKTSRVTNKKPTNFKTLAVTKSVTIEEMIRVLLKRSDNHYTEHLYQLMKLQGVDVAEFWKGKGIDTGALVMYDGSGLSRGDYISADILTQILTYMYTNYPDFIKLFPRGGYDGTVSDFLGPKVFNGEARIKSGSMSGIQSYTGYLIKGDKKYGFTIVVNHWNGKRTTLKKEMEKVLTNLF